MVVERTLAIIAIVWLIGILTDSRWRALAYSLPIPMTIVLVATGEPVEARHTLGVVLLAAFFRCAVWLRHGRGLGMAAVVAGAVALYVAAGFAVAQWWRAPMAVSAGVSLAVIAWWLRRDAAADAAASATATVNDEPAAGGLAVARLLDPVRLVVITTAASLAALLGSVLGPLVVTFPYSGLPLLVDGRDVLRGLSRGVTRNAVALVAFFAAVDVVQDAVARPLAIGAGWVAFAVTAAIVNWRLVRPVRGPADPATER
jgi:hypothetical protein